MSNGDDPFVCFCVGVPASRIREAVLDGATDVESVRRATGACSGCQSCWVDIEGVIAETRRSMGADDDDGS
ncbi:MAG: (2Fe-2S)-binding protein [Planctomycetota bacterium]